MLNHLFAKIDDLRIAERDVLAQTAPQCFDISLWQLLAALLVGGRTLLVEQEIDRKSTRLNSSHGYISYAVFCLKKKKQAADEAAPSTPFLHAQPHPALELDTAAGKHCRRCPLAAPARPYASQRRPSSPVARLRP